MGLLYGMSILTQIASIIVNASPSPSLLLLQVVFSSSIQCYVNREVSLWAKLAYAVGSMPYAMCNTVTGFYFSIFLLEVVIVSMCRVFILYYDWFELTNEICQ